MEVDLGVGDEHQRAGKNREHERSPRPRQDLRRHPAKRAIDRGESEQAQIDHEDRSDNQ